MCESEKLGTDENTEINNSYFQYYAELKEEFPKIFDLRIWTDKIPEFEAEIATLKTSLTKRKNITEKEKKIIQQKIAEK